MLIGCCSFKAYHSLLFLCTGASTYGIMQMMFFVGFPGGFWRCGLSLLETYISVFKYSVYMTRTGHSFGPWLVAFVSPDIQGLGPTLCCCRHFSEVCCGRSLVIMEQSPPKMVRPNRVMAQTCWKMSNRIFDIGATNLCFVAGSMYYLYTNDK